MNDQIKGQEENKSPYQGEYGRNQEAYSRGRKQEEIFKRMKARLGK